MRYDLVNNSRRQRLVQLVYGTNPITTRQACQKLGINISTAKYILKVYRRQGRIDRQTRRQKPNTPKANSTPSLKQEIDKESDRSPSPVTLNNCELQQQLEEDKNFNDPQSQEEEKKIPAENNFQGNVKDFETLKRLTVSQLQGLLGELNSKEASQKNELKIISQSYTLIQKLLLSLETREAQIRKQKDMIESEIIPSVLNELRLRERQATLGGMAPLTQELLLSWVMRASNVESLFQGVSSMMMHPQGSVLPTPETITDKSGEEGMPSTR